VAKPNRCTYYFELLENRNDGIESWKAGVYSAVGYMGGWVGGQGRLSMNSDKIWCQGPRGGVKIVKDRTTWLYGYVTNNPAIMKKFTWIKLSARHIGPK
jgi:hypothetical protein